MSTKDVVSFEHLDPSNVTVTGIDKQKNVYKLSLCYCCLINVIILVLLLNFSASSE